jgi:geranylgeranyl diphosphate synthase type II
MLSRPVEVDAPAAASGARAGSSTSAMPNHPTPVGEAPPESLTRPLPTIEAYFARCIDEAGMPGSLADGVRYSFLGPGKRLRPLLSWHACAALGPAGNAASAGEPALPAAAAVELVHCFSLVHDDLPGLDNDDLRRGRPTLHKATSEAMAILAGDAMLTLAFSVLTRTITAPGLASALVNELSAATGAMIAGQVHDTLGGFPEGLDEPAKLRLIHTNKTGALIRASIRMGALCAHPLPSALSALSRYADAVGLMFQIVDDLLDVTQTTEHLGKKAGKDQCAGKLTYPGVLGVENSRNEVARLRVEAIAAIAPLGPQAGALRDLAEYLAVRSR